MTKHIIVLRIEADDPNDEFTDADLDAAVRSTLHEVFPKSGDKYDEPVIPRIESSSAIF